MPDADKAAALDAAVEAVGEGFGGRLMAVRINVEGMPSHGPEMVALKRTAVDYVVLPKVENAKQVKDVYSVAQKPVIAMIESAEGRAGGAGDRGGRGLRGLVRGHQ